MRTIQFLLLAAVLVAVLAAGCGKRQDLASAAIATVVETEAEATEAAGSGSAGPGCTDSDNGINAGESGSVEGVSGEGADFDFDDRCVGTILIEYSCENNGYTSQNIRCSGECEDGACK